MNAPPIAVLGAGSWGTALAMQLARARPVRLWGRNAAHVRAMADARENAEYLPRARFPNALEPVARLAEAVAGVRDVIVVVPSHALRELCWQLAPLIGGDVRVAHAAKGFEHGSGRLPHQVAREAFGDDTPLAVLSGPTFALEVAAGLPTAIVAASRDAGFAADLVGALHHDHFRVYTSDDVTGVEVAGAVKNVLAIGAGISDGLGFGANARAALITRGLGEMRRMGAALGGREDTFFGLAGIGDLVLTCTDDKSRNRRMGLALGRGEERDAAARGIRQVVEGIGASREVMRQAQTLGLEMPICAQIHAILFEGVTPSDAFQALMERAPTPE